MSQLVTVKDAAIQLSCSEAAIRKWIYQGKLPRVKVGRLTRLRQRDIDSLINDGLGAPRNPSGSPLASLGGIRSDDSRCPPQDWSPS